VKIFKHTWFSRFVDEETFTNGELREAVEMLEVGHAGISLGAVVFKIRLARLGEGKFGGYRAIVFFRSKERTFLFMDSRRQKWTISMKNSLKISK